MPALDKPPVFQEPVCIMAALRDLNGREWMPFQGFLLLFYVFFFPGFPPPVLPVFSLETVQHMALPLL